MSTMIVARLASTTIVAEDKKFHLEFLYLFIRDALLAWGDSWEATRPSARL